MGHHMWWCKVSDEMEKHFPIQDVMDALGLVYPKY
jgi:hypothetical protein